MSRYAWAPRPPSTDADRLRVHGPLQASDIWKRDRWLVPIIAAGFVGVVFAVVELG